MCIISASTLLISTAAALFKYDPVINENVSNTPRTADPLPWIPTAPSCR